MGPDVEQHDQKVIPNAHRTINLTEAMIDAPRGFLMGLELGCHTLKSMREHLDRCGYDYACWPDWAKQEIGHMTKAGKAILIYTMMVSANHAS